MTVAKSDTVPWSRVQFWLSLSVPVVIALVSGVFWTQISDIKADIREMRGGVMEVVKQSAATNARLDHSPLTASMVQVVGEENDQTNPK